MRPLLALGVPAIQGDARSLAIISDSIGTGQTGHGLVAAFTLASGGTGFTAADVGRQLVLGRTGATAGAVANDAVFQIMAITVDAISSLRLIETGTYVNVAGNPSQTLPSATLALAGATAGIGAQVSGLSFASGATDLRDNSYAQGFAQRALSQAGMRWTAFTAPGDGMVAWTTRDYGRLAYLGKCGVTSALVALGINDKTAGQTAAAIQAAYVRLARKLKGIGIKGVYLTTMMPGDVVSTDGYATLAGQTVQGSDAVRQTVNAWARGGACSVRRAHRHRRHNGERHHRQMGGERQRRLRDDRRQESDRI